MLDKINSKKLAIISGVSTLVLSAGGTVFAAEGDVSTSITGALTTVKSDALSTISAVAPIGIAIMGVFLVWRYGIRFFKSISK